MIRAALIWLLVTVAFLVGSWIDTDNQAKEHAHACEMIAAHVWPTDIDPGCKP